jgi:hypothetical protein
MAMRMTARKFTGPDVFKQMKDEEYLYWASVSASESIAAGHQMSVEGYRAYGYTADGRELKTVALRLERP